MIFPLKRYVALLGRYLSPQWPRVTLLAALLLTGIGLDLASPQVVRYFIDTAQAGGPEWALLNAALAFLAFGLGARGLALAASYVAENTGWAATNAMREDLTLHALHLDMPFHKRHTPGELIERIDGDVGALANFFSEFAIRVAGNGLLAIGILVLLYREDWRIGLGMSFYVLVVLVALGVIQRVAVPRWAAQRKIDAELFGFIEERIAGREEIQAAGAGPYTLRRLYELLRTFLIRSRAALVISHLTTVAGDFLFVLGYATGLGLGAYLYSQGQVTIGTAYLIVYYVGMLAAPLTGLREQARDLQRATASVERAAELLAQQSQLREPSGAARRLPAGGLAVDLEGVTFRYHDEAASMPGDPPDGLEPTGDGAALCGVSFRLEAGHVLGLLGRTGSGKTTLGRLLFRLYDPSEGTIRLQGIDLREMPLAELRQRVGIVTQDVQLFQATVRDNLTFFDREIVDAHIEHVLRELGLWDWVRSLPRGLDTELAAGGQGLSAGEAQLLAFARVFLRDPGIVVLDEASSRLDPATEALLEQAIGRLLAGRTGIIIAHRLVTVQRADDLLILEDGQVVEHGPREQLAADAGSRFASLLRAGLEEALA